MSAQSQPGVEPDVEPGAESGPEPDPLAWTGPWADDARRLFRVLQGALEQAGDPAEFGDSGHSPDCAYCPLCRGIGVLRRAGPDVLDRVGDLAAGLAETLRRMDAEAAPGARPASGANPPSAGSGPRSTSGSTSGPARPPSTVRIDVTD